MHTGAQLPWAWAHIAQIAAVYTATAGLLVVPCICRCECVLPPRAGTGNCTRHTDNAVMGECRSTNLMYSGDAAPVYLPTHSHLTGCSVPLSVAGLAVPSWVLGASPACASLLVRGFFVRRLLAAGSAGCCAAGEPWDGSAVRPCRVLRML